MLLNMHIKNIVLIDDLDINFDDGLNILTGETGAGKSIIIGSLGIGTGGKFHKELLRNQEQDGLVELVFSVEGREDISRSLTDMGIICDDDEVLISRRLCANGRTINRINDDNVTVSKLRSVSELLIDLHAQHEQQTLLKADRHLAILDRFGGDELLTRKARVQDLYQEYMKLRREYEDSSMDEADRNRQMDFLDYQIKEIKAANPVVGEDVELEQTYKRIVNSKEILQVADEIYKITGYDNVSSAAEQISHALQQMGRLTELDGNLMDSYNILQDIDGMLNDFNRELSGYMEEVEFDGNALSEIEDRLNLVNSLKAKYGNSIELILHTCEEYEEEYNKLISYEQYIDELSKKINSIEEELNAASKELSDLRKKTAKHMCELIRQSLGELNFMSTEFEMKFNKKDTYSANGFDEACFMISTNIGEPMRPLYEVASGGELSRVMLAIKSSLAYEDDTPSLVFDEIDVGISGRTAQSVAKKMSVISRKHQVICITHLPQIASMADSHYIIEKNVENNKTNTSIRKLSKDEEIGEIARLLGGEEITKTTITSAEEMKRLAERTKIC